MEQVLKVAVLLVGADYVRCRSIGILVLVSVGGPVMMAVLIRSKLRWV